MTVTTTELRKNIFTLLDQVAQRGITLEVKRKGKIIRILADKNSGKLSNLKKHSVLNCEPSELLNNDWSSEWQAKHI